MDNGKRYSYEFAITEYKKLEKYLTEKGYRCEPSGSLRRRRGDVGDIDFLVEGEKAEILSVVGEYPQVEVRINKYEFQLKSGIVIHTIPETREKYNYTLWQSTGPKKHVRWIKNKYAEKEVELKRIGVEEEGVYSSIGLDYIPPEERYKYLGEEDDQKGKN